MRCFDSGKIFLKFLVLNIDTSLTFFEKKLKIKYNYFVTKNTTIDRQIEFFLKKKLKIKTKCIENFFEGKIRNRN